MQELITVGDSASGVSRTKSCEADPGFSLAELKGEAARRGIFLEVPSRQGLLRAMCTLTVDGIPGLLYHRKLAMGQKGENVTHMYDLDKGEGLNDFVSLEGNFLGVSASGLIVLYRGTYSYLVILKEVMVISQDDAKKFPRKMRTIQVSDTGAEVLGVVEEKIVYREIVVGRSERKGRESLKTFDLNTGNKVTLLTGTVTLRDGEFKRYSIRDNYLLIQAVYNEYTLFDVKEGKKVWKMSPPTEVQSFGVFLVNPKLFLINGEDNTYIYYLGEGGWLESELRVRDDPLKRESFSISLMAAGMSLGRLLVSDGHELFVFDTYDALDPYLLTRVSINPLGGELETTQDYIVEFPDGRILYQNTSLEKQFLVDVDYSTLDNIQRADGNYFPLPPSKAERRRFKEVILEGSGRIPDVIADIIERFI